MDTQKQEMEMMHSMCQKEFHQLKINLSNFLQESDRVQRILNGGRKEAGDGSGNRGNMFALIAFDRYMSQLGVVLNMARKFNIQLQLNKLCDTVINPSANNGSAEGSLAQTRVLQDYIEWSNTRLQQDMGHDLISETGGDVNKAIGLEIPERLTWKKDNLSYSSESQQDVVFKRKAFGANQIKVDKQCVDTMTMLEDFLQVVLPTKSLTHFKADHEFSGSITYVHDYKELVFFICELNDYKVLYEFSNSANLTPIQRSNLSDAVFCVSQGETEQDRGCVWRAVMVPDEGKDAKDSVYLIDFGEIIALTDQCKLYRVPLNYIQTPPFAIKCILNGVQNAQKFITRNQEKCEQVLRSNEYKMVQFRVVQIQNKVLHLVLLEKPSGEIYKEQTNEICKEPSNEMYSKTSLENETFKPINNRNSNPFLNSTLLFDDEEENSNDNLDPLPIPISAIYNTTSVPDIPTLNVSAQLGDSLQVLVTHVISPISFYGIIENNSSGPSKAFSWPDHEISTLQKQMSAPEENNVVLAQYIKDEYWYRAKVIDIIAEKDMYKVFYVDFGNTEIVPLSCLAKCTKQQLEDPLRAVLFHLANLSVTMDDDKDDATLSTIDVRLEKAIETLVVLILDQTLNVEVVERHKDDLVVRLTDEQYADIPQILIDLDVVKEL